MGKVENAVGKDRIENIVGKGENAGYQLFLLFQQTFQKASSPGLLKYCTAGQTVNLVKKVKFNFQIDKKKCYLKVILEGKNISFIL